MQLKELNSFLLEDIQNPSHPSEFNTYEDYGVMILRLPEQKEEIEVESFAFIIEGNNVFLYDREKQDIKQLGELDKLNHFLDVKVDHLIKQMQQFHYKIDMLEESLYEENLSDDFMQEWLYYKKNISLIHRVMFHSVLAFEQFFGYIKKQSPEDIMAFDDLLEHMQRVKNLAHSAMEKLDNLYDFYRAKVDEKMNKNVYYLTMISGIFLPLTLITGFFGMNTGGLPFMDDPEGTNKAIFIALILEVFLILPIIMMNNKKIKRFSLKKKH
ncbi:MAG: magnesium transporter [Epsilonproteobacteria bacterium]|nr:magnesium transporter [Campylobacterota bacterium]